MYVGSLYTSISETFLPVLVRLKKERTEMPRILIYCLRFDDCADLYLFFKNGLSKGFTEPPDSPDYSRFRLVEMFTSCTDAEVKSEIISSFTFTTAPLRLVCGTVTFGMGIDCSDVSGRLFILVLQKTMNTTYRRVAMLGEMAALSFLFC